MIQKFPAFLERQAPMLGASPCEHRTVSKDGRIICKKIMVGDNGVSPNECRACPFRAVNCQHLRFSLQQTSPRPLVVRYNGREEVWDDDPAELRFEQAACAVKVMPVQDPRVCAGCALRQAVHAPVEQPVARRQRRAVAGGKVVAFPGREAVAAGAG
jgi:hypothetical protein